MKKTYSFLAVLIICFTFLFYSHAFAEDDYGDSFETATPIQLDTELSGNLDGNSDTDYLMFTPSEDGEYYIEIQYTLPYSMDIPVNVYDSDKYRVYQKDLNHVFLEKGVTYFLEVPNPLIVTTESVSYNIKVIQTPDNYGNDFSSAKIIDPGSQIEGQLSPFVDEAFFQFTTDKEGYYAISIETDENASFDFRLYNDEYEGVPFSIEYNYQSIYAISTLSENQTLYFKLVNNNIYDTANYKIAIDYMEDDYGNDISSAQSINLNQSISGNLETWSDRDYFSFITEEAGYYCIDFGGDTYRMSSTLYDENGIEIVSATDKLHVPIVKALDKNKKYYIKVYSRGQILNYTLSVKKVTDDFGDDIDTAHLLQENNKIEGFLDFYSDIDFFEFSPLEDGHYKIQATRKSSSYLHVYLYDDLGNLVTNSTNGRWSNFQFTTTSSLKKSKKYFIKICNDEQYAGDQYFKEDQYSTAKYTLNISFYAEDDHGNEFDTATDIKSNEYISGNFEISEDIDVFRFVPEKSGKFLIKKTGPTNLKASIYDKDRQCIKEKTELSILQELTEGQPYYIYISKYSGVSPNSYVFAVIDLDSNEVAPFTVESQDNLHGIAISNVKIYYKKGNSSYTAIDRSEIWNKSMIHIENADRNSSPAKSTVVISGLDWDIADTYLIWIWNGYTLHKATVKERDAGKSIVLKRDGSFVDLNIDVDFKDNLFNTILIQLNYICDDGSSVLAEEMYHCAVPSVPQGSYNIRVKAEDQGHTYALFRKNCNLSSTQNSISFTAQDVSELKINMQGEDNEGPWAESIFLPSLEGFSDSYISLSSTSDTKKPLYISKLGNQSVSIETLARNYKDSDIIVPFIENHKDSDIIPPSTGSSGSSGTIRYYYYTYSIPVDTNKNNDIYLDAKFKSVLNLDSPYYLPGSQMDLTGNLGIFDSYNNNVYRILNLEDPKQLGNTLEFKSGDKTVLSIPDIDLQNPVITFPSEEGTYQCTFSVKDSLIPIEPVTVQVRVQKAPDKVSVQSITISGGSAISSKGGTLQLAANILPDNASDKSVIWSVSNENGSITDKATISTNGLLTAKSDGKVKVVAAAGDGSGITASLVVTISNQSDEGNPPYIGGDNVGGTPPPAVVPPAEQPDIAPGKNGEARIAQKAQYSSATGESKAFVDMDAYKKALGMAKPNADGNKTIVLEIPEDKKAKAYVQQLPAEVFTKASANETVQIITGFGAVTAPCRMLDASDIKGAKNISLTVSRASKDGIDSVTQSLIGDSPVIDLSLNADGKVISWSNPDVPVEISIPYVPTAEELKAPEHIVVWYIDGSGNAIPVPNGRYNPQSKMVTFTTTHFSKYAVGFTRKTYSDITKYPWIIKPVEVLASKGIIEGASDGGFAPDQNISRGEFMMWLVKTLNLNAGFDTNFSDTVKEDRWYEALGIAKKLGIAQGGGNNTFSPEKQISRQDMMALTVRTLKAAGINVQNVKAADLSKFADSSQIASYAKEDVSTIVGLGFIQGSGKNLNPTGTTTRAEVAIMLYRIYNM
ncbi:S-layer family protein [Anaerobacterium chartisolvens]|uniref:S-layer family protein n=1 Tax=Anaerobacterium chartisolvens TaxID=1297424 RepID=A0A369BEF8_9FIRM|nr:S-layer homology domain-containing protein [Anaerobacterium chartisolvens]RCX18867.1 S-layer family protein [Anaerobacterium chartisolvens]